MTLLSPPPPPPVTKSTSTTTQLSSSQSSNPLPEAPDRAARLHCWRARDAFFACLEQHAIVDSIRDAEGAARECGDEGVVFERECRGSWVSYFKQRRVMEFKRKETIERLVKEGAKPMAVPEGVLPPGRAPSATREEGR